METAADESRGTQRVEAMVINLRQQIRRVRAIADRVHGELMVANAGDEEAGWRLAA